MDKENQNIDNPKESENNYIKDSENNISNKSSKESTLNLKKKRDILKKLFKYFLWFDTAIFILFVTLVILLQTTFFKTWILHIAIDKINNSLASKDSYIYAESLEGNIITNLKLNNAFVIVKGDTLLKLKSIKLGHKFFRLFDKVIDINDVVIEDPEVNITKVFVNSDTLWNFEYLFKPEIPEIDTIKKEFDWDIFVNNANINNSSFRSVAYKPASIPISTTEVQNEDNFDFNDVKISNINLNFNGKYTNKEKILNLKKLILKINTNFDLENLSFNANINNSTKFDNFNLKTTKTNLEITDFTIDNFSPLEIIDFDSLKDKNFVIKLKSNKIDLSDIKYFKNDFNVATGKYEVLIDASGKYKDFNINNLILSDDRSKINLSGRIVNLDSLESLYLNLNLVNSELDPVEIRKNLPGVEIPDLSNIGKVYATVMIEGELKRFFTKFNLNSSAGAVQGDARIDLNNINPVYKASGSIKNLNVAKITRNPKDNYLINSEFTLDGVGVDYKTMTARLNYNLSNSTIANQKIIKSAGEIRLNKSMLNLDVVYISNAGSLNVAGDIDFRNFSDIKYNLKGTSQNLNLSAFSPTLETSNLNFEYDITGSGIDFTEITNKERFNPDKLIGEFKINLGNSVFDKYSLPASPIYAVIKNDGQTKDLLLASNFIDISCNGNFSFETIPTLISTNVNNISRKLNERLEINPEITSNSSAGEKDNNEIHKSNANEIKTSLKVGNSISIRYNILIKSLLPLYIITKDSSLSFTGLIKGELKQTENVFAFSSEGRIDNFQFKDSVFRILKTNFSFDITDLNQRNDYRDIYANLYVNTNGIYEGNNKYESLFLQFNTIDTNNFIVIQGTIDSNFAFYTKGNSKLTKGEYNFFVDSTVIRYFNYQFSNPETLSLSYRLPIDTISSNDILFKNFTLRDKAQKVVIAGIYSIDGNSDLNISASRISINELFKLFYGNEEELIQGNIRNLYISYTGTLEKPNLNLGITTDPLSIKEFKLGRIDAIIDYNENIAKSEIGFFNPNNEGKLSVKGDIPIKNPFIKEETPAQDIQRNENVSFLESEVNLMVTADNYQTKIFEKFIPLISELDAKVNSDILVKGKIINPEITGDIKVNKGSFKFNLTGVKYNFNTILNASGQKLLLNHFKLFIPESDDRFINSTGYIDLTGLKFNGLDLIFTGDVKVLTPDITRNEIGIYGDLIAGAGETPIRIKGYSDSITLTGTFALKKGNIFIPSLKSDAYSLYVDNINYKVLIDTTSFLSDSLSSYILSIDTNIKSEIFIPDPYEYHIIKPKDTTETKIKTKSNFLFNINIVSVNKIFLKFVVDEQTRQEFMGEINLKLYADNRKENVEVRGIVDIDENSIYKFYKNFNATGNIKFTGEVTNPDLNIVAEYSGSSYSPEYQTSRNVIVQLNITGNLKQPELKWRVYIDGTPISTDPTDEAISFLLFGKLKSELNASQRLSLVSNIGANIGSIFLSTYLNQFISTYLPFILSTDINYIETQSGNIAEATDIRFTAGLGDATIRFGGHILTDLSNTNFMLEYPLNKLFKIKSVSNNLIFKFERIIDPYSQNTTTTSTNNRTGASLVYRIKF